MPDVFTKKKRSEVMAKIRSRGNKETELVLAKLFRKHHINGWRRHVLIRATKSAIAFAVRPDFVFRRERVAVFVDGCFWHGCPRHANLPVGNRPFWRQKLAANRARDRLVTRTLRRLGWRVVRLWEHELKKFQASRFKFQARRT